jgi:hypothetical protein
MRLSRTVKGHRYDPPRARTKVRDEKEIRVDAPSVCPLRLPYPADATP